MPLQGDFVPYSKNRTITNSGPRENRVTITAILEVPDGKGGRTHELEKQISPRSIHSSRNDGGDVSSPPRRCDAGCLFSAVSHDGWGMGNFRLALRETEINTLLQLRTCRIVFRVGRRFHPLARGNECSCDFATTVLLPLELGSRCSSRSLGPAWWSSRR
jgi:hypothetical protein